MKLYLISQEVNNGYDTYDSFVVCASDEEDARIIYPLDDHSIGYGNWVSSPDDINVKFIGEAAPEIKRGVVLGSYNAG